jgi:hypothetical protein
LSDIESKSSNENYSLILNLHDIYRHSNIFTVFVLASAIIIMACTWGIVSLGFDFSDTNTLTKSIGLNSITMGTGFWLLLISSVLGIVILKKRTVTKRGFAKVQSSLVRRSYILNFELEESVGTSQKDKIFNHLCLVFPQINEIKKKRLKRGYASIDQESKWRIIRWHKNNSKKLFIFKNYDIAKKTSTGFFILKIVNDRMVTFEDIENEVKDIHKKLVITSFGIDYKDVVDRLIFLVTSFDDTMSKNDLDFKMKNLKRNFLIDIIREKEYGYSTIWVD